MPEFSDNIFGQPFFPTETPEIAVFLKAKWIYNSITITTTTATKEM